MPGFTPVAPGSYTSAVIILLTDGQATTGPNPIEAARMAADRGVRVFTVGIGTTNGGASSVDDWSLPVLLDEQTLQQIAGVTKAEYFYAGSAPDLSRIYKTLRPRLFLEKKETEISALFSAAAVIFSLASGFLSLLWFNRSL
jgi:Ca-activated chloride channel family protein